MSDSSYFLGGWGGGIKGIFVDKLVFLRCIKVSKVDKDTHPSKSATTLDFLSSYFSFFWVSFLLSIPDLSLRLFKLDVREKGRGNSKLDGE